MKILCIASEATPFVKSGGLADVIGSLPKELNKEGVEVRVMLPKHSLIAEQLQQQMSFLCQKEIKLGWRNQYGGLFELVYEGVTYYFIDNQYYFHREQIYGYEDNFDEAERYSFFCTAALEILPHLDFQPDLIHAHDWHTAIVPYLLRSRFADQPFYQSMKTVFTIHNIQYQGIFSPEILFDVLHGRPEDYTIDGLEYNGAINFMKAGIMYSDVITTVSPSYAQEIQTAYYGEGLDGLLRGRERDVYGIINGLDEHFFHPSLDSKIAVKYDLDSLAGKKANKRCLQEMFHCQVDQQIPILAMVTRLADQKGIELFMHVLDEVLQGDIQCIVLGSGRREYEQFLEEKHQQYPDKLKLYLGFNEELAHQIYAGADLFLMPSRFEPCGLGQLIALSYGTLPIVRETGGLRDTVAAYNKYTGAGNGFRFQNYNAHELLFTVKEALRLYEEQEVWYQLVQQAMSGDYSWRNSARKYRELYQGIVDSPMQGNAKRVAISEPS